MTGWVYVMTPVDYQHWLSSSIKGESVAAAGAELYEQFGCVACHGTGKGPSFAGLYGKPVLLSNGAMAMADEDYLRESILYPSAKIVNGYPAIMPTFKGQISEEQLLQGVEKSLRKYFGKRGERVVQDNLKAVHRGYTEVFEVPREIMLSTAAIDGRDAGLRIL